MDELFETEISLSNGTVKHINYRDINYLREQLIIQHHGDEPGEIVKLIINGEEQDLGFLKL